MKSFSAYYILKVHLYHFSNIKNQKEVTKQWESRFFLLFLFNDRRIRIRYTVFLCPLCENAFSSQLYYTMS
jgi:hypothetical protein